MYSRIQQVLGHRCATGWDVPAMREEIEALTPLPYNGGERAEIDYHSLRDAVRAAVPIVWARSWVIRYPGGHEEALSSATLAAALVLAKRQQCELSTTRRNAIASWCIRTFLRAQSMSARTRPNAAEPWAISAASWRLISNAKEN